MGDVLTIRRYAAEVESVRERQARTVPCPTCHANPGANCTYDSGWGHHSHTTRYEAAAAVGLVPPLPGGAA